MPAIERALLRVLPFLAAGLVVSVPLLAVTPGSEPLGWFIAQLVALVILGYTMTAALMSLGDEPWFEAVSWGPVTRSIASGVALVILVTGTVGLVTLASSAALGFDPSLQFLQLLSALDIAWVGAATMIGAYRAFSRVWALIAGAILSVICVWSIWNYLSIVGFGTGGSWIVSGSDLAKYVLPFDVAAAVMAVAFFLLGVRSQVHVTEQLSPQS